MHRRCFYKYLTFQRNTKIQLWYWSVPVSLTSHVFDERRGGTGRVLAGGPGISQCIHLLISRRQIFPIELWRFWHNLYRPLLKKRFDSGINNRLIQNQIRTTDQTSLSGLNLVSQRSGYFIVFHVTHCLFYIIKNHVLKINFTSTRQMQLLRTC